MSGESDKDITFYPKKGKILLLLFIFLLSTAFGIWMLTQEHRKAWYVITVFSFCSLMTIAALLPQSNYLRLSTEGFTVRSWFVNSFTPWTDVDRFAAEYVGLNKIVVFNYSHAHRKNKIAKFLAQHIKGFEAALPHNYGKKAEDLANLLNQWKSR